MAKSYVGLNERRLNGERRQGVTPMCEVPCKPVGEVIEILRVAVQKKVSLIIFMWVIGGIIFLSGALLNTKMETIGVQIKSIEKSVGLINEEVSRFNYRLSRRGRAMK